MSIETLQEILKLCEKNGWRKPTCYQGSYNILTRGMEAELLPLLRANGMSFNAFQYVECPTEKPEMRKVSNELV